MEKKACTFFGHRDGPETIKPKIREAIAKIATPAPSARDLSTTLPAF